MKPLTAVSRLIALGALAVAGSSASAAYLVGSATGLVAPTVQITFDEPQPVLAQDTVVGSQYASLGATFDYLYFNPGDDEGPYTGIDGHYLGNFFTGGDAEVATMTITFSNPQTRAAFGLASNGGEDGDGNLFTFSAYLGNQFVDSFAVSVGTGYYGFTDLLFDRIVVTSFLAPVLERESLASDAQVVGFPDFYLLDNLQFDAPSAAAAIPEPGTTALLGLGLFGVFSMRRRTSPVRAA